MNDASEDRTDLEVLASKWDASPETADAGTDGHYCTMCCRAFTPEEKDDPNGLYHEVVSWVTGPKLQSPVLRRQTMRLAHVTCVEKVLNGQSPDQETIPGLEL